MRFFSFQPIIVAAVVGVFSLIFVSSSSAGDRVLYLGDSFSMGAFGRVFDQRMRESGLEVYTSVAGGASPYYWLKAYDPIPSSIGYWQKTPNRESRLGYIKAVPKVEDLMADIDPNIVVVQTGVNLYAVLRSKRRPHEENVEEIRKVIRRMCAAISNEEALGYWVLPPHSHEERYPKALQQELAALIREEVKKFNGAVFESQNVTKFTANYPATDGIHYGSQQSEEWAERVANDFKVYLKLRSSYAASKPTPPAEKPLVRAVPVKVASVGNPRAKVVNSPSPEVVPKVVGSPRTKVVNSPSPEVTPVVVGNTSPKVAKQPAVEKSVAAPLPAMEEAKLEAPDAEVDLNLKLLEKSVLKDINGAPYNHALGVFEYEVLTDNIGNYPLKKIRVAHGIVFNRRFTSSARREIGAEIQLRMVPLKQYPNLKSWETVDELTPNFDMPLYTPKLD